MIRLPYFNKDTKQQWRLEAIGGSRTYKWHSQNFEIASVTGQIPHEFHGVVYGIKIGETNITVFDSQNPLNNDTIWVIVSSIGHLGWLEEEIEVKQFQNTHIALMAYDIEGHKFTNCSSLYHSMNYDQNKFGFVETQSVDWHEIKAYLNSNIDIVKLWH